MVLSNLLALLPNPPPKKKKENIARSFVLLPSFTRPNLPSRLAVSPVPSRAAAEVAHVPMGDLARPGGPKTPWNKRHRTKPFG